MGMSGMELKPNTRENAFMAPQIRWLIERRTPARHQGVGRSHSSRAESLIGTKVKSLSENQHAHSEEDFPAENMVLCLAGCGTWFFQKTWLETQTSHGQAGLRRQLWSRSVRQNWTNPGTGPISRLGAHEMG